MRGYKYSFAKRLKKFGSGFYISNKLKEKKFK